jgi:hypothetical protein
MKESNGWVRVRKPLTLPLGAATLESARASLPLVWKMAEWIGQQRQDGPA